MKKSTRRGFTLIELLIVIGVLAILTTVVVLVLNPTEMLQKSRDSRRLSELNDLNRALQIATVNGVSDFGSHYTVYVSIPDPAASPTSTCSGLGLPSLPTSTPAWSYQCSSPTNYQKINGTGWVPVNFSGISVGSPLATLPIDPINTTSTGFYYTYTPGSWILTAPLESSAYQTKYATPSGTSTLVYVLATENSILTPEVSQILLARGSSGGGGTPPPTINSPTVTTAAASNITASGATLNGSANPNNADTISWFRYDTINPSSCNDTFGTRAPLSSGSSLGSGNSDVPYYQDIAGLVAGTPYYFCAIAENSAGKTFGSIISFTTSSGRYWVGGTGNWSDTAHWSVSSSGTGGVSVPTASDDVYFDANSGGGIVTVDTAASTKNLDFTGYTGTFAGSATLNIAGSFKMVSGMALTYTGAITFSSTSTGNIIILAGKILGGNVNFNGSGGWTLQDDFNVGIYTIFLTMGSLNTNNQIITCGTFDSSNSNTRSLTLGSSSITCSTSVSLSWNFNVVTGLTFNAGTSQINFTGSGPYFYGGGLTYNNVIFNSSGVVYITGINTFNNLTRNGTAVYNDALNLGASQTITGTLTLAGNSAINRLFVYSSTLGTSQTLTAAAVSLSNVDFRDISGAGAATFSGTSLGNTLGNSNINFTPAVTRYWVGDTGNWSDTNHWSASSGGAGGASIPLAQDNVIFDANSITLASQIITTNMSRLGTNINFSAVTNNPTLSFSSITNSVYGSLTLGSNMIIAGLNTLYFYSRTPFNLINNGRTFTNPINIYALGGTIIFQDAFNSTNTLTLTHGTLNANNQNITATSFLSSNTTTRTVNMGSGTWTLTGISTVWNTLNASNLTFNADTSSIVINNSSVSSKTFSGGGKTYYNLRFTNTGTGALIISGSNTFNNLTIDTQPKTVNFVANTTQTINGTFIANGSTGSLITSRSGTSGTKWNIIVASTSLSYVDVKDSAGSGAAAPFVCGATCVNSGNNTGWNF